MTRQEQFDAKWISSTEICQRLAVARATVFNGAKAGKLPEGVVIRRPDGGAHITLYDRAEAEPMLIEWAKAIASRKGQW